MLRPAWDVLIAGAGPAGSRAAELLRRRGASVLLLDPKAPWEKPCGGGLTAAALENTPELRELQAQADVIREVRLEAPSGASVVIPVRRPYLVVSRRTLSRWGLARAERAGARFLPAGVDQVERTRDGWQVRDTLGLLHRVRWLVGADGAASRIRRAVAPGLRPELAPTRVVYPESGTPPGRAAFSFLPAAQGYVWDFPRPGHHSIGIGVAPGTYARNALDGALTQYQLAESGSNGGAATGRGAVIATSAWLSGSFADLGAFDYALLGDAAGLADPASGEGIDYALRSARLAADAFSPERGFADYPAAARRAFAGEMRRAKRVRRWLYHPGVAEWIVRRARRSPRAALVLMSLSDAINEHGSQSAALWRALTGSPVDRERAWAVCDCPDGAGGSAPVDRANAGPGLAHEATPR